MSKRALILSVLLPFFLIAASTPLPAQTDYSTATLKGTVFYPQELLVADANVTVNNPNTGWSRVAQTGDDDAYRRR